MLLLPCDEHLARIALGVCIDSDMASTAQPHSVRFVSTGNSRAVRKFYGIIPARPATTCTLNMRSLCDRPWSPARRSESSEPQAVRVGTHTYIALRATIETTARPNSILSGTFLLNWDTLTVRCHVIAFAR